MKNKKLINGQSLIEVLIAFAVVVIIGIALISASLATQRVSISARAKSQASDLAKAYLDQVRIIRDIKGFDYTGALSVSDGTASTCYAILNSDLSDPSLWSLTSGTLTVSQQSSGCNVGSGLYIGEKVSANNINYFRKVTIVSKTPSSGSPTSETIQVDVKWKEGVNDRSVSQQTILSKWCGGPVSTTGTPCP